MKRTFQQGLSFLFATAIGAGLTIGHLMELLWVEYITTMTGIMLWFLISWYFFDWLIVEPAPPEKEESDS